MCRCGGDIAQGLRTGYWVQDLFPGAAGLYIPRTKPHFYELFSFPVARHFVLTPSQHSWKNDFHEYKFILWIQPSAFLFPKRWLKFKRLAKRNTLQMYFPGIHKAWCVSLSALVKPELWKLDGATCFHVSPLKTRLVGNQTAVKMPSADGEWSLQREYKELQMWLSLFKPRAMKPLARLLIIGKYKTTFRSLHFLFWSTLSRRFSLEFWPSHLSAVSERRRKAENQPMYILDNTQKTTGPTTSWVEGQALISVGSFAWQDVMSKRVLANLPYITLEHCRLIPLGSASTLNRGRQASDLRSETAETKTA